LTAGGERGGDSRAELHHASGEHQITCCESDRCEQQTMQAIQGTATPTDETNKHCIAIAGIKIDSVAAVHEEIR